MCRPVSLRLATHVGLYGRFRSSTVAPFDATKCVTFAKGRAGADMTDTFEEEREAIFEVIQRECLTFFNRDFQGWADTWLQDEGARRLGAAAGGQLIYHESWNATAAKVGGFMKQFPNPNPQGALTLKKDNFSYRITSEMAWVSFDQYGEDTGDPFDSIGLSHHICILEKHAGQWKIAFIGHGETSFAYFSFPVVHVDINASIQWMNEAARQSLRSHSTLMNLGGTLRARRSEDDKRLHQALETMEGVSSIVLRQAHVSPDKYPNKIPVALSTDTGEISDICWVSKQDEELMISFNDTASEKERLDAAAKFFRLSPSQARIAELIVSGENAASTAKSLNISVTTARTQLNRMFEKTGTHAQTALVRALLSVGAPNA